MNQLAEEQVDIVNTESSPLELEKIAEKKAAEILEKIKKQSESIAAAKTLAENAKNYQRPWHKFFSADIKTDKIANALVVTNDALTGLSDLVQESIRYTCTSIEFAQIMHKTMAHMMVHGFKNSNGELQKLGKDSKDFVEDIISAADDFVRKQRIIEHNQAKVRYKLNEQSEENIKQSLRIDAIEKMLDRMEEVQVRQDSSLKFLMSYTKNRELLDDEKNVLIAKLSNEVKYLRPALFLCSASLIASFGTLIFRVLNN